MMFYSRRKFISYSGLGLISACSAITIQQPKTAFISLTISAAVSLKDALNAIATEYHQTEPNLKIAYNFGSSGSLQQQIEQGAPIDIFISASPKQMQALKTKNLLMENTENPLVSNQMVLIVPPGKTIISSWEKLTSPDVNKIVIGEPNSVPAGQYAQEILTKLGLYNSLSSKLVFANNVRQALTYVETGNVDAGIVYITDAKLSNQVQIVAKANPDVHTPIIYPIAILKNTKNFDAAKAFMQFIFQKQAQQILANYGFKIIQ